MFRPTFGLMSFWQRIRLLFLAGVFAVTLAPARAAAALAGNEEAELRFCSQALAYKPPRAFIQWIGSNPKARGFKHVTGAGFTTPVAFFKNLPLSSMSWLVPQLRQLQDQGYLLAMVADSGAGASEPVARANESIQFLARHASVFVDYYEVLPLQDMARVSAFRSTLETALHVDCMEAFGADCASPILWSKSLWLGDSNQDSEVQAADAIGMKFEELIPKFKIAWLEREPALGAQSWRPYDPRLLNQADLAPRWVKAFIYGLSHREFKPLKNGFGRLFGRNPLAKEDLELIALTIEAVVNTPPAYAMTGVTEILNGTSSRLRGSSAFGYARNRARYPERPLSMLVRMVIKTLEGLGYVKVSKSVSVPDRSSAQEGAEFDLKLHAKDKEGGKALADAVRSWKGNVPASVEQATLF